MFEYTFNFMNLNIRLEAPFEILVCRESEPFVIDNVSQYDLCVRFEESDKLPALPANGTWVEDMYYTTFSAAPAVYVRNYPNQPPYAVLVKGGKMIRVHYLRGSEKRICETSSILNLLGIEKILLDNNGFLLHSSFIRYRGRGILFSAPSGTGKSTQADLWEKFRGSETLNGDRAGVRFNDGVWTAFGMPFAGTSGVYRNDAAPIAAIVTLEQGANHTIRRLRSTEAVCKLLPECSCRRWDSGFMNAMLDLILQLLQQIPVYLLECRPDEGAVKLLHETLVKDERL